MNLTSYIHSSHIIYAHTYIHTNTHTHTYTHIYVYGRKGTEGERKGRAEIRVRS